MDDLVMPALRIALDALAQRQRVIADNVANIQTPGYLAKNVDFESALQSALDAQPGASASDLSGVVSESTSTDPVRQDGNNVNLDTETLLGSQTNLRYEIALRAVEGRFTTMRDVLRSS